MGLAGAWHLLLALGIPQGHKSQTRFWFDITSHIHIMCTQRKVIGMVEEEIIWEGQGVHGHLDPQPDICCPQALAAFT